MSTHTTNLNLTKPAGNERPDVDVINDNMDIIDSAVGAIAQVIYPVGSIYMSVNPTSPATLFGGTWEQIQDTFLLAAGQSYAAGSTGGEATHALTPAETAMKNHTHTMNHGHGFTQPTVNGGYSANAITGGSHSHGLKMYMTDGQVSHGWCLDNVETTNRYESQYTESSTHTHNLPSHTHTVSGGAVADYTGSSGGQTEANGSDHNNMPPYLSVYVWKRTA